MKNSTLPDIAGVSLILTLLGAGHGFGQLIWDAAGEATVGSPGAAPGDGSGNWLGTDRFWDGADHVTWSNGSNAGTIATFGAGGNAGAINLTGDVSAGGLRFNAVLGKKGYQFMSGGTLTLAPDAIIDIFSGSSDAGEGNRIRFQNVLAGSNPTITNANDPTPHTSYVGLYGANTWSGKLTLSGHTGTDGGLFVNVRNSQWFGSLSEVEVKASTTLSLESSGMVIPNTTTLRLAGAGLGGRGAIRADQSATINSNIILAGATRLGTNASSDVVVTINGNITGAHTLTLGNDSDTMAGRYVFKGTANTYTGLTVLKGNAQIGEGGVGGTGSGITTMSGATAVVSGTGTSKGFLINNGTIRPGDNGGVDRGVFNVSGNLNFTGMNGLPAARTAVEFSLGAPSDTSDRINVTGNLRLHANGNIVVAFDGGYSPLLNDSWTLFSYGGTLSLEGNSELGTQFSLGTNMRSGADDGSEGNLDLPDISATGYVWNISSSPTNSALVISVVIPEPASITLTGAATLLFLRRRRR
jgi:predicted secreted protein